MKIKELLLETKLKLGGFSVTPLNITDQDIDDDQDTLDEELELDVPGREVSPEEMHGYLHRSKTKTKTKREKFGPIIHGKNIKAILDDNGERYDLDDFAKKITTRPRRILGKNAKMVKSAMGEEIVYDTTLPAIKGIVYDEKQKVFVEISTCTAAGKCQLNCYARKGGYIQFSGASMASTRLLNFLLNDPKGYMALVKKEIASRKRRHPNKQLVIRWHDAGDFFSKKYRDLVYDLAKDNPDIRFYAYTKVASVSIANKPDNFIINFSYGAKPAEEKAIEKHREETGETVKSAIVVPRRMFWDLIARDGNTLIKDDLERIQFKSPEALDVFKDRLVKEYHVDLDTIITYDEMLNIPPGTEPQWNVIVQPGAGDISARRKDVIISFLMEH